MSSNHNRIPSSDQDITIPSNNRSNFATMAQSSGVPQRIRNEESWVDISSQPSSSSLSSMADEIVTTGLRVQQPVPNFRRHRRPQPGPSPMRSNTGTSSQEEYEESESEEDHVLTSSSELPPRSSLHQTYTASTDDEDENATAVGVSVRRTEPTFTPQPNAFSHPPARMQPSLRSRPDYSRRATYQSYTPVDHDAALRASLTTLLSIGAAAARGLPKRTPSGNTNTSTQPMTLGLVPESELFPTAIAPNSSRPLTPRSSPSIASEDCKRKLERVDRGLKKKKKVVIEESPALMGWVVGASVVVLVSVVGFGAGYVIGREVGRGECTVVGGCGREVVRGSGGLRRLRWGGVARRIVA